MTALKARPSTSGTRVISLRGVSRAGKPAVLLGLTRNAGQSAAAQAGP